MTGGLGFIGSNLALALGACGGADVIVVDALKPRARRQPVQPGVRGRRAGPAPDGGPRGMRPCDPPSTAVELVFNLAGQVSHVDSMKEPLFDLA